MIVRKILLIFIILGISKKVSSIKIRKISSTPISKFVTTTIPSVNYHNTINNQNTISPAVATVSFVVAQIDFIDNETKYNNDHYNYTLALTLVTQRDYFNLEDTYSPKKRPFSSPFKFGFIDKPVRTMKNLSFHLKIIVYNKSNLDIEEYCNENVLTPITQTNGGVFARLCREKFKITLMLNYTCTTIKMSKDFCDDESTHFQYDANHYQCLHGNYCQSLMNSSDFFTCHRPPPPSTSSTSTTSTTTTSTIRTTSTITTKLTTKLPSTSSLLKPLTEQLDGKIVFIPSTLVPKLERPNEKMFWYEREICISTLAGIAVIGGLVALLILNICCLMAMKKNHGSYRELFCGPQNKTKNDHTPSYHGNEDLYSQPWDGKENATLDHLFVSMPDIRENLVRNSDHIYAVPQLPQNLNNIVQYRKLPNNTDADNFPASVISHESQ